MPIVENDRGETEEEEMEQDQDESDKSSEDETGSATSEGEDDTSDLDDEESERRKNECLDDMNELERQFYELKEQLYRERMAQVSAKLEEVRAGKAVEYLNPLAQLQDNMRIRAQIGGVLRGLRIHCIETQFDSEKLSSYQNMESEKSILRDTVKQELEDKIRRLEEDRNNIDISSDLWNESQTQRKKKRPSDPFSTDRRRKPVTVSGPYIVYMLKDVEVIEDWTAIKKALKQQSHKRKPEFERCKELHSLRRRFGRCRLQRAVCICRQPFTVVYDNERPSSTNLFDI